MIYAPKWGSRYSTIAFKYLDQSWKTLRVLFLEKPRTVFVMTPPVFACLPVWIYTALSRARFVIDAHSGAFLDVRWTPLLFVHRFFSRRAALTIVTNEHLASIVSGWQAKALIISDLPVVFPEPSRMPLAGMFNVTLVNTFTRDEPLAVFLAAARDLPDVRFYVTGRLKDADPSVLAMKPRNVEFTDFLPADKYVGLLLGSDAVMSLTTLEHTMQRGAYEAVHLGKPILVTGTAFLRQAFPKGAVHVENTAAGIVQGIKEMKSNLSKYQKGVDQLRVEKLSQWNRTQADMRAWLKHEKPEPEHAI